MSKKVFVNPPRSWAPPIQRMFAERGFEIVDNIEACDIIAFAGGEDINPALYGEKPNPEAAVYFSEERDKMELDGYELAKKLGKFKFGICRGGQLLNVLNGGKLWQHVDNHGRAHNMSDVETGRTIWTSSVHHQQFILGKDAVKVAVARETNIKVGQSRGHTWYREMSFGDDDPNLEDVEVAFYPNDRALCIQGHPEYGGYEGFTNYAFELLERYF